jgi:hypothetical protein
MNDSGLNGITDNAADGIGGTNQASDGKAKQTKIQVLCEATFKWCDRVQSQNNRTPGSSTLSTPMERRPLSNRKWKIVLRSGARNFVKT